MLRFGWTIILGLIFFGLSVSRITGQTKVGKYMFFGQEDIPSNTNRRIFEDSQGFLWLATQNGLFRYDGYEFDPFYSFYDDSNSLSSNAITDIEEDGDGHLWIATADRGVNKLNKYTGRVTRYPRLSADHNPRYPVYDIYKDKQNNMWFATGGRGISRYISDSDSFAIWIPEPNKISDGSVRFENEIWRIQEDPDSPNILWIAAAEALYRFNTQTNNFEIFEFKRDGKKEWWLNSYHCLFIRNLENIWLGTWGGGLIRFNYINDKFEQFPISKSDYARGDGTSNVILDIYPESDTTLYICSFDRGLFTFDEKNLVFMEEFSTNVFPLLSKETLPCRSISKTRDGSIWVSGENYLLHHHALYNRFEQKLDLRYLQQDNLAIPFFTDALCLEQTPNHLVAISRLPFCLVLDKQLRLVEKIPIKGAEKPFANLQLIRVNSTYLLSSYSYPYLSFWNEGECCFTPVYDEFMNGFPEVPVFNLCSDGRHLWFNSATSQIWQWDIEQQRLTEHALEASPNCQLPSETRIRGMEFSSSGTLWIATSGGLYQFDTMTVEMQHHCESNGDSNQLATPNLTSLETDKNGLVWVGVEYNGLQIFDPDQQLFVRHFSLGRQTFSNHFDDLTIDLNNNVWATSNHGLLKFDHSNQSWHSFTMSEGLEKNYLVGSVVTAEDGKIFLETNGKINAFYPDQLPMNNKAPVIHITDLTVNGKSLILDTLLTYKNHLFLEPFESQVSIRFAAVETIYPKKVRHEYRLLGVSPLWKNGDSREVTFADLDPGPYEFQARAYNSDGVASANIASFSFEIRPKLIQRAWFQLSIALVIIALGYLLYRYRLNDMLKIQSIKNRISADLHDDIGARLTSIQLLAALTRQRLSADQESGRYLHQIQDEIDRSTAALDEIVWNMKTGDLRADQLLAKMRHFANNLFEPTSTCFRLQVKPGFSDLSDDVEKFKDLFLIYRELLNNSQKHAQAMNVIAKLDYNLRSIRLEIRDDGIGFDPEAISARNGIRNIRNRIKTWQGDMIIKSNSDHGTWVMISMPRQLQSPLKGIYRFAIRS